MSTYTKITYRSNAEYREAINVDPDNFTTFSNCTFLEPFNSESYDTFINCKFTKPINILPEQGSFIAWKKVYGKKTARYYVLKLLVLNTAKRVTPYVVDNRKCRVSAVRTLAAFSAETGKTVKSTQFYSGYDGNFTYEIGKVSKEPKYDGSRTKICTQGIHVFLTKQEAMDYDL